MLLRPQAQSVIEANNLSHIIKVLHGRVEDVEIKEKVDVIVSEWMGYMLLYENMLGSVIIVRDRWLKPGGLMIPSDATCAPLELYMAPITNINKYNETTEFWRNVYGIDMSAMIPSSIQCKFEEPSVETISADKVLARPHVVKRINCHSVTIPKLLSVTSKFKFTSTFQATLHGFAFWFDAEFNGPVLAPEPISWVPPTSSPDNHPEEEEDGSKRKREPNPKVPFLSTSPGDPSTHWYQSSIYLYDTIEVEKDQLIEGLFRWSLLPEKDYLQLELHSHLRNNFSVSETTEKLANPYSLDYYGGTEILL
ncbi:hypothetical protein RIF29_26078 [Crotalaria pallida]|uniref:Protein arginine N-methyltransferase domain-containing protein n=1 Tax=Crotalaria pallida TaxID=3830 RepID=A0AAN9EN83_CROPI